MTYLEWKNEIISLLQTEHHLSERDAVEYVEFHFSDDFDKIHYDYGFTPEHIAKCIHNHDGFYDELISKGEL